MIRVTALRTVRGRRVRLYLDGKPAVDLEPEVAAGLWVGQELSEDGLRTIAGSNEQRRCLNAAMRYLAYRPRSQDEIRRRLAQRGFGDGIVAATLAQMGERGLLDDRAFAAFWKENREEFRPRSRRLTRLELLRKGVDQAVAEAVVGTIDDTESAYRAAQYRVRTLPLDDRERFRRRLGDYLRRRGFGYEVIGPTVERLWQERGGRDTESPSA